MPLNKLENFIKNTEGRILYVNPNDLDATDGIENAGNSLTKPFKTIQRALIESARFSYLRGDNNDITEKTTILLYPGEHLIDNRPGYAIKSVGGTPTTVSPSGAESFAGSELTLTLDSNFDLTQENNILHKFNSINGGIIIPRGTSIVGLDLRKTKIRPKYVPNPTDETVKSSAIFRITGACYFWQFSIFDGDESGTVYTDPVDFSSNNRSKPIFSHHKLTCFEYADGVNLPTGYDLTDLDMYYAKLSNAYNKAAGNKDIDQKYPTQPNSFAKQRPEWEIVGAFAADPITISSIISGDGATPGNVVTVTTSIPHGFSAGTPVKIRGINVSDYNISTKVTKIISDKVFAYSLSNVRANLPAGPGAGLAPGANATATIETDTVTGASPYIFNISLRSVFGMQGMHADGSKADGFRSMVVAQFTAVSLQKDDRAFVKYNPSNRTFDSIGITKVTGSKLSSESSATNDKFVYHLDSDAVYREGWKTTHIKMTNDAVVQIVSVFAIGFHKHFEAASGGDASITNSNSNFGQFSLAADGFKPDAFDKDDKGYVTSIVAPKAISGEEINVEWVQFDVDKIKSTSNEHLYLLGYTNEDIPPPVISQGYRIGAREGERIYLDADGNSARVLMTNGPITSSNPQVDGTDSSVKRYDNVTLQNNAEGTVYTVGSHNLQNGESVRIFSETGDLPEGLEENVVYFAVTNAKNTNLDSTQIQLASSRTNAEALDEVTLVNYGGEQLRVESRVSDKKAGELGHPLQFDPNVGQWCIHTDADSALEAYIKTLQVPDTEISYFKRIEDERSLDEKLYKIRYVVPKNLINGRDPIPGFVLQDSSSTNVRQDSDFNAISIDTSDYDFNRNVRFISSCTFDSGTSTIEIRSEKPHGLKVNDKIFVENVTSTTNTPGTKNIGYNGTFSVETVTNDKVFSFDSTDVFGTSHNPGTITNDTDTASNQLPRFTRKDVKKNYYIYRVETIKSYVKNVDDGIYYLYALNADASLPQEFVNDKYSQNVTNLYPQLDRDNFEDNPPAAKTFAKRFPLGDVVTNDLKRSLTRENTDMFLDTFGVGFKISSISGTTPAETLTFDRQHNLNKLVKYNNLSGGSGHVDGTYRNVRLFNDNSAPASAVWDGATADVTVSSGAVTAASIVEGGSGYTSGETLYFDSSHIGGAPNANVTTNVAGISTAEHNYVQVTGIGTTAGGYFRVNSTINSTTAVSIAKTAGDPISAKGQIVLNLGIAMKVTQVSYTAATGITRFTTAAGGAEVRHGLLKGNSFRILDNQNNNLGDFTVSAKINRQVFEAKTDKELSTTDFFYILKHGMSANDASADASGENFGARNLVFYDNEQIQITSDITTEEQFQIYRPSPAPYLLEDVPVRFPLGCYIQVDNEIMRIRSNALSGTGTDEIQVIRGAMGTLIESHAENSVVKKIKLLPIEFHRPSILRASGHTFEYLGYGPGNYSTGLPQVQVKTLTEDEEFLSQSQETSCGTVLYTGMDSDGDFYIGNTKYSSQSGEQTVFDVPVPTITGEDPNRLSVVFDEVIVKERILVEGGSSQQILSQFDGPVTFNADTRFNAQLVINDKLRVTDTVDFRSSNNATSCDDSNAALRVKGGVGIGSDLYVCGNTDIDGTLNVQEAATFQTGIVPDADEGAYLGTSALPWSEAHIDEIIIGSTNNTVTTATGKLVLDSNGGTVDINDQLKVSGITTFTSTQDNTIGDVNTGAVQLDGGMGIAGNLSVGGNLDVDGDTTLDKLTVSLDINADGNIVGDNSTNISGINKVNATNFEGSLKGDVEGDLDGTAKKIEITNTTTSGTYYLTFTNNHVNGDYALLSNDRYYVTPGSNAAASELRVRGDIIAFAAAASDDKLKTNKINITGALDKVNSLTGFTFEWNEVGNKILDLGDNPGRQLGVSAQEVQKVLPEAVKPIVTDREEEFLSVKYEKLVPLLIEAVKELSDKISALEDRLNN
jgi:hypothetical protein|tara:strand:- start:1527 stop:7376 length:5850 start_codon:yes stop_codon:yes gene_type:complete